ncbi:hypothetical protein C2G38_2196035 [Gigaspora rosea]|uniref:Uncharacterized protein n=1 Tax=Gigaspora rosea TaxID=44941 RepID=A0A397UZE4_9GLOM|nr:hypothetical protein C2G38_2196035 [Gigaspora rosea]
MDLEEIFLVLEASEKLSKKGYLMCCKVKSVVYISSFALVCALAGALALALDTTKLVQCCKKNLLHPRKDYASLLIF